MDLSTFDTQPTLIGRIFLPLPFLMSWGKRIFHIILSRNTNILVMMTAVLFVLVLPVIFGPGMLDVSEDQSGDDCFLPSCAFWGTFPFLPVHGMHVVMQADVSIFALFLVFRGGRSKHKRFNDRTLDPIPVNTIDFVKTALFRAVFNFFSCPVFYKRTRYLPYFSNPIPIL